MKATGDDKKSDEDDFPVFWTGLMILVLVIVVGSVTVFRQKLEGGSKRREDEGEPCPGCGSVTTYSEDEDDHYCWECEEYVGDMRN